MDNKFWYYKCIYDFNSILHSNTSGTSGDEAHDEDYINSQDWHQFYLDLEKNHGQKIMIILAGLHCSPTVEHANSAAAICNIEGLNFLYDNNIFPTVDGGNLAAQNGHYKYFLWLDSKPLLTVKKLFVDHQGMNLAIKDNHYEIINWGVTHEIYPTVEGLNIAAQFGHLNILQLIKEKHKLIPDIHGLNNAIENNHLDVIIFIMRFSENNSSPKENTTLKCSIKSINIACGRGYLDILEYIDLMPEIDGIINACINGHTNVIEWCTERSEWNFDNKNPNLCDASNITAQKGHLEVLKILAYRNIFPSDYGMQLSIMNRHYTTFNWLIDRKIKPNIDTLNWIILNIDEPLISSLILVLDTFGLSILLQYNNEMINILARNERIDLIILLQKYGYKPNVELANILSEFYTLPIMTFLDENKIYPNQERIDELTGMNNLNVLRWLVARNILPSVNGINTAAKYGHNEMLLLISQFGINPTIDGVNDACGNNHIETVKLLISHGIHPDVRGANKAAENGHLDMLKYLATLDNPEASGYFSYFYSTKPKLYPNEEGIRIARDRNHVNIIEWLKF